MQDRPRTGLTPVPGVLESLGLSDGVAFVDVSEAQLPAAVSRLAPVATIWVLFRKGSKAAGLDMNRDSLVAPAARSRHRGNSSQHAAEAGKLGCKAWRPRTSAHPRFAGQDGSVLS